MAAVAREVNDFVALPIQLPSATEKGAAVPHYIYIRPHDPKVADEDAARSLFLVNVPVNTTADELKDILITQLQGGRVEYIQFPEDANGRAAIAMSKASRSNRKRKRMTADEIEAGLIGYGLPKVWYSDLHTTGGTALVVFVDRPAMELTLKAARRATKLSRPIKWREGSLEVSSCGLQRYKAFNALRYPSRRELLRSVDGYMSAYAQVEEARVRDNARKRQMPDEDGFITVTRGSKGGIRAEDARELGEKQKAKDNGVEDFYRFQMREKRKEQHDDMVRKFDDDKKRMAEMRHRRGAG